MRLRSCSVCGSDVWGNGAAACDNVDDAGVPCLGLSDGEAALVAARAAYAAGRIGVAELERRVEVALTDPPRRRFSLQLVAR